MRTAPPADPCYVRSPHPRASYAARPSRVPHAEDSSRRAEASRRRRSLSGAPWARPSLPPKAPIRTLRPHLGGRAGPGSRRPSQPGPRRPGPAKPRRRPPTRTHRPRLLQAPRLRLAQAKAAGARAEVRTAGSQGGAAVVRLREHARRPRCARAAASPKWAGPSGPSRAGGAGWTPRSLCTPASRDRRTSFLLVSAARGRQAESDSNCSPGVTIVIVLSPFEPPGMAKGVLASNQDFSWPGAFR